MNRGVLMGGVLSGALLAGAGCYEDRSDVEVEEGVMGDEARERDGLREEVDDVGDELEGREDLLEEEGPATRPAVPPGALQLLGPQEGPGRTSPPPTPPPPLPPPARTPLYEEEIVQPYPPSERDPSQTPEELRTAPPDPRELFPPEPRFDEEDAGPEE